MSGNSGLGLLRNIFFLKAVLKEEEIFIVKLHEEIDGCLTKLQTRGRGQGQVLSIITASLPSLCWTWLRPSARTLP